MVAVIFRLEHYETYEAFEPLNLLKGFAAEDAIQWPLRCNY
jgi:hypothetical protein